MRNLSNHLNSLLRCLPHAILSLLLMACAGGDGDSIGINSNDDEALDPVVVDVKIAYIRRNFNVDANTNVIDLQPDDVTDFNAFVPGAAIAIRDRASNTANETDFTHDVLAFLLADLNSVDPNNPLSINEVAVDFSGITATQTGDFIAFSARLAVIENNGVFNIEDTTWNVLIYDVNSETLSFAIPNRLLREGEASHPYHDIHPQYLSDRRIVFSSTRQNNIASRLLDEGRGDIYAALIDDRSEIGFQIHTIDLDNPTNDGIEQITHNVSHDVYPSLADDGAIIYTRFDNMNGNNSTGWNLYKVNPSGRGNTFLYGYNSHNTGSDNTRIEYFKTTAMPNGDALVWLRDTQTLFKGGDFVTINTDGFVENETPIINNLGAVGPAQNSITSFDIRTDDNATGDGGLSIGGRYSAATPLFDGTERLLVSWSPCRLVEAAGTIIPCSLASNAELSTLAKATPSYGMWIFDPASNTQLPVILANTAFYYSDIIALETKPFTPPPNDTGSEQFNSDLALEELGQLFIDSVYDFSGIEDTQIVLNGATPSGISIDERANPGQSSSYLNRPARFIRLLTLVPQPDEDIRDVPNFAFGLNTTQGMRDILGYAPVMPDGSVSVTVPANRPFTFTLVDENLRRVSQRHTVWLELGAGEKMHCVGCHNSTSEEYHGRLNAQRDSIITGAQSLSGGIIGFPNTKTDPGLYPATELLNGMELGESMAKLFDSIRPIANPSAPAFANELEVVYDDLWADTANGLSPDDAIDYTYGLNIPFALGEIPNQNSSGAPINRIVINYLDHIQPIWERDRPNIVDAAGAPILDENGAPYTNCIGCHSSTDANGAPRIPAAQLDLTATPSDEDNNRVTSYRELLTTDDELWLDGGSIVTRAFSCEKTLNDDGSPILDIDGNPTTRIDIDNATITSVMRTSGANNSRFFECFEQANGGGVCEVGDNNIIPSNGVCTPVAANPEVSVFRSPLDIITFDHRGLLTGGEVLPGDELLTDSELRLISEWLDIGAQYYNDPYHPDLDD